MSARVLKVHPADNVIVALRDLSAGERIEFENDTYELPYAVGAKHKFVTEDRQPGDPVTMYGVLVGKATRPIQRGEPITTFNLKHDADRYGLDKNNRICGIPPTFRTGRGVPSWGITAPMAALALVITGSWYRWFFARIATY